jgi:molecular chaperone DnaK (HSP70)
MITAKSAPVLGIDLGTTTSLAAVLLEGQSRPIIIDPHPDLPEYKRSWLPSVVCMIDGEPHVGEWARQWYGDPRYEKNIVRCVKREMRYASKRYDLDGEEYTPAQISSFILAHLRKAAAHQLDMDVKELTRAVITVPAYFGQVERGATQRAGKLAGFEEVHLLDEPIAAALGLRVHEEPGAQLVMVIDLGGGTLDVTLLMAGREVPNGGFYELGRDGDGRLGGVDWDVEIALFALQRTNPHFQERIADPKFMALTNSKFFDPCEEVKQKLCSDPATERQAFRYRDGGDPRWPVYDVEISREEFLAITQDLRTKCVNVCNRLLREIPQEELRQLERARRSLLDYIWPRHVTQLSWEDVDHVYMVGGGSRVRSVQEEIGGCWSGFPELAEEPELQIVYGAAQCAASLDDHGDLTRGERGYLRCPHSIGIWYYPSTVGRRAGGLLRYLGREVKRANSKRKKASRRKFHALIHKNERIPVSVTIKSRVEGHGSVYRKRLIEERTDPHDPNPQRNEYIKLGELVISDIPPAEKKEDQFVTIEFHYNKDRVMTFSAEFRRKSKRIDLKETDHAGELDDEQDGSGEPRDSGNDRTRENGGD